MALQLEPIDETPRPKLDLEPAEPLQLQSEEADNDIKDSVIKAGEAALRTAGFGFTPQEIVKASTTPIPPLQALRDKVRSLGPKELESVSDVVGQTGAEFASGLVPTTIADLALMGATPALVRGLTARFPLLGKPIGEILSRGTAGETVLPKPALEVPTSTVPTENPQPLESASLGIESASPEIRQQVAKEGMEKVGPPLEGPFERRIDEPALANLTEQTKAMGNSPIATDTSKRAFQRIMELVETGEISEMRIADVAGKHGINPVELAAMVGEEFSRSGRVLNKASQVVKALNAAFESNPEAKAALAQVKTPVETPWMFIREKIRSVESMRRRLLVTQLATAARNLVSQGARSALQVIDDSVTGTISAVRGVPLKSAFSNALEDILAFGRSLTPGQRNISQKILEHFPTEAERLLGTPVGDVALTGKAADLLNAANVAQEQFFRNLWFDARTMGYLRSKGVPLEVGQAPKTLPEIPEAKIQEFVNDALELTFAKAPGKGTFGKGLMDVYNQWPFLTALFNPFPRFWSNSIEFLAKYSPLGLTRFFSPAMRQSLMSENPQVAARALSQAFLGTAMWGAGWAIRNSEAAGPKWYQIRLKNGSILDARPFAPFSTYLFIGEAMRQAMGQPTQLDGQDFLQGLVSINRIAGTGLVVVDVLRSTDLAKSENMLQRFAGEWVGSWSTWARTAKDFAGDIPGAFGERERTIRSRREDPLVGPLMSNIPGLSQRLPAQASPYESSPIVPPRGQGTMRQLTGVSIRDFAPLEAEANRLGVRFQDIGPKTGDAKIDRLILEKMGSLAEKNSASILHAISQARTDEEKEAILKAILSRIKYVAAKGVAAQNQTFAIEKRKKGLRGLRRIAFEDAINRKQLEPE